MTPSRRIIFREIYMHSALKDLEDLGMAADVASLNHQIMRIQATATIAMIEHWESDRNKRGLGILNWVIGAALIGAGALIAWRVFP